jgi:hypothetical protein
MRALTRNNRDFLQKTLAIICFAFCISDVLALEKIAGVFLGALPADLRAAGFELLDSDTPNGKSMMYVKETNQQVSIYAVTGQKGISKEVVFQIKFQKNFQIDEAEKCKHFLRDIHSAITSDELSVTSMRKAPLIFESVLPEFTEAAVNKAYSIGDRQIHYYCAIMKTSPAGQKPRIEAHYSLHDKRLLTESTNQSMKSSNQKK